MRKRNYRTTCIIALLVFTSVRLTGQVNIAGPTCVTSNIMYLYTINGTFDSSSTINVCVTGGTIDTTNTSCKQGDWFSFIEVAWDNNITGGSIVVTSSSGNDSLNVAVTLPLSGGTLDTSVAVQLSDTSTIPGNINCSMAAGGGCDPIYLYQWEQSADNMSWDDIPGATGQGLNFTTPVLLTTYYRRKTKTTLSDAVAYTPAAVVVINPIEN